METNENNIILVLLNFSLAFICVITVFTKIHTALPSFLSTCIGPNSHSKAKALYSCMRTHIGKVRGYVSLRSLHWRLCSQRRKRHRNW